LDLENSYKKNSFIENERMRIEVELNNFKDEMSKSELNFNKILMDCKEKKNQIEMKKNNDIKDNSINNLRLENKINNIEKSIEKTKIEGKNTLNSHLMKGQKLRENLILINEKIKSIIDTLPEIENDNNVVVKKELKQIKSLIKEYKTDNNSNYKFIFD
jgi:hypothetical protein